MAKVFALCQEAIKWGRFGRQLSTYFTTTRHLLTFDKYLPGVFFLFSLGGHYKNRFFQEKFLEKIRQDVKICPQNAALPPPPFFCQSEAICALSI